MCTYCPGSGARSGPWIDFQYRNEAVTRKIQAVQAEIFQEFTLTHPERALSRYVSYKIRCEEQRLGNGCAYEPPTFVVRRNWGTTS